MRGANMDIKDNELIKEIKYAIEHRELKAYYQPQYDSITNRLVSAEALVRWIKNDGTMVMPGEFIPELEKSDAIIDVDWYMLEEVCRLLNRQEKESVHRVPIAVNFSRMHILYEDDLVERLCNIADRYQIPHSYIEIEITESAFVDKSREIANLVRDVRKEGFAVAIDDFGSCLYLF
jgi:EAL domain-containing protein (putative c-di-GMP-specific phosphodiesterase class I)